MHCTRTEHSAVGCPNCRILQAFGCSSEFAVRRSSAVAELEKSYFGLLFVDLPFEFASQILSLKVEAVPLASVLTSELLNFLSILFHLFCVRIHLHFSGFGGSTGPLDCSTPIFVIIIKYAIIGRPSIYTSIISQPTKSKHEKSNKLTI
jgi:hypothetical protein